MRLRGLEDGRSQCPSPLEFYGRANDAVDDYSNFIIFRASFVFAFLQDILHQLHGASCVRSASSLFFVSSRAD